MNKELANTGYVELSKEAVQQCEAEPWPSPKLHIRTNGTGWLDGRMPARDIPFFAKFFVSLGKDATVQSPPELIDRIKQILLEVMGKYTE